MGMVTFSRVNLAGFWPKRIMYRSTWEPSWNDLFFYYLTNVHVGLYSLLSTNLREKARRENESHWIHQS